MGKTPRKTTICRIICPGFGQEWRSIQWPSSSTLRPRCRRIEIAGWRENDSRKLPEVVTTTNVSTIQTSLSLVAINNYILKHSTNRICLLPYKRQITNMFSSSISRMALRGRSNGAVVSGTHPSPIDFSTRRCAIG